jgi:putative transcriptional regulator
MTTPLHHPPDEYLLSYAAGGLSEGEAVLVATHSALCRLCRKRVGELEAMAGALLLTLPKAQVSPGLLQSTLARLDAEPRPVPKTPPPPPAEDAVLPRPLLRYTGPFERIAWKKAMRGVWFIDLPVAVEGVPVRLCRFARGVRIPPHTHGGAELELLLSGGAVDDRDGRLYERGDVAYNDENDVHSVTIEPDEACIALGVHVARLQPRGLWSRLVFGYLGW